MTIETYEDRHADFSEISLIEERLGIFMAWYLFAQVPFTTLIYIAPCVTSSDIILSLYLAASKHQTQKMMHSYQCYYITRWPKVLKIFIRISITIKLYTCCSQVKINNVFQSVTISLSARVTYHYHRYYYLAYWITLEDTHFWTSTWYYPPGCSWIFQFLVALIY